MKLAQVFLTIGCLLGACAAPTETDGPMNKASDLESNSPGSTYAQELLCEDACELRVLVGVASTSGAVPDPVLGFKITLTDHASDAPIKTWDGTVGTLHEVFMVEASPGSYTLTIESDEGAPHILWFGFGTAVVWPREDNDAPNDWSAAQTLSTTGETVLETQITGDFTGSTDVDWYVIDAPAAENSVQMGLQQYNTLEHVAYQVFATCDDGRRAAIGCGDSYLTSTEDEAVCVSRGHRLAGIVSASCEHELVEKVYVRVNPTALAPGETYGHAMTVKMSGPGHPFDLLAE